MLYVMVILPLPMRSQLLAQTVHQVVEVMVDGFYFWFVYVVFTSMVVLIFDPVRFFCKNIIISLISSYIRPEAFLVLFIRNK